MPIKDPIHKKNYSVWRDMMRRCYDPRVISYKWYGARGIKVCNEWHDFHKYLRDVGTRPTPTHSLDRINNDGDYSPENVRWATKKEQVLNRRPILVCRSGHAFTDDNTKIIKNPTHIARRCKICLLEYRKKRKRTTTSNK